METKSKQERFKTLCAVMFVKICRRNNWATFWVGGKRDTIYGWISLYSYLKNHR